MERIRKGKLHADDKIINTSYAHTIARFYICLRVLRNYYVIKKTNQSRSELSIERFSLVDFFHFLFKIKFFDWLTIFKI